MKTRLSWLRRKTLAVAAVSGCCLCFSGPTVQAFEILGTGTGALLGNDLTDLGDDGAADADIGYDAIFDSSDEQGFGGGEFAFNVFDNRLGPGNDKWCCGMGGGIDEDNPAWVSAQLPVPHFLTHFTVSSANDVPERDPIFWAIQGSNNGNDYTDIYVYEDGISPWDERLQVALFSSGEDFPVQEQSYEYFRMATYDTLNNPNGAYFQIGEIKFFGNPDGVVPPIYVGGQGSFGQELYEGTRSNEVLGPVQDGVPGFTGRIVTFEEHGQTVGDHTTAELILEDFEGETAIGAYPVVDFAGGGGTYGENYPYPNGVADTSMNDFVVQVTADVVIPAGSWSISFGSDDGGQVTIPGIELIEFEDDNFQDDQIRFEGNRGHAWTTGTFELAEELSTTITGSFHERGGGDSFEIAILNDAVLEDANPANGWELLGDGVYGWSVTTSAAPLASADLSAEVLTSREFQFDVNGDTGDADQFVVENPDPAVFTTILNVDGATFQIAASGDVSNGEAFRIIDADTILGTPTIVSVNPNQNWVFDAATGRVCLGSCPGNLTGDFNGDGSVTTADLEVMQLGNAAFDVTGDGLANAADVNEMVANLIGTWIGDSNGDGEFGTGDFVQVFTIGKFETGQAATWSEGDWNLDGKFDTSDFVAAFTEGGFERGPRPAVSAVPEPAGLTMIFVSLLGLLKLRRK
ncbi:MAG: hypothetical protein R3C28_29890 [Pirellulaceae bacterium]